VAYVIDFKGRSIRVLSYTIRSVRILILAARKRFNAPHESRLVGYPQLNPFVPPSE